MAPPSSRVLFGLWTVAFAAVLVPFLLGLSWPGELLRGELAFEFDALKATLPGILWITFVGRLVLSLLPSGRIGGHHPRELAATWAASYLCGLVVVKAQVALFENWHLGTAGLTVLLAFFLPWFALAAIRLYLLPGSIVAGREPPAEPSLRAASAALLALLAVAGCLALEGLREVTWRGALTGGHGGFHYGDAMIWKRGWWGLESNGEASALATLSWLALIALFARTLSLCGAPALTRRALLLLLLPLPLALEWLTERPLGIQLVAFYGMGAAGAVLWLRRADRRGAALAALGFGGCALWDWNAQALTVAGLLALLIATPRPSRVRIARLAVPLALILALLGGGFEASGSVYPGDVPPAPFDWSQLQPLVDPRSCGLLFPAFACAIILLARGGRETGPSAELLVAILCVVFGYLLPILAVALGWVPDWPYAEQHLRALLPPALALAPAALLGLALALPRGVREPPVRDPGDALS